MTTRRPPIAAAALHVSFALLGSAAALSPGVSQERDVLGRPAAIGSHRDQGELLPADTAVYATADAAAAVVLVLDVPVVVEVLERREGWLRVRLGATTGWVALRRDGSPTPLPRAERAAAFDPAIRARRLEEARALLGGRTAEHLGGRGDIEWLTDLPPRSATLDRLRAIAGCLPALHRERYGVEPRSDVEAVRPVAVVFARERDYRAYVERLDELADLETGGHAADSVLATYAGNRDPDDVAAIFAHELVHVLDARSFPFPLPAWLEEGLAQDLGLAAAAAEGCPKPGEWPGARASEDERVIAGRSEIVTRLRTSGEARVAACAARAWSAGEAQPRLAELVALPHEEMAVPSGRSRRYVAAAALVRAMVDGDAARRDAFRALLARHVAGESPDIVDALEALGTTLAALEREIVVRLDQRLDPRACDPRIAK
jgi:hypothetical protein